MAIDATMLAFGQSMNQAMWRLYGWTEPAMTFGYSQKWSEVRGIVGDFDGALVRRQTGGGIVDHRSDLTYALSLPPAHPFHRRRALEIYGELHQGIADILLQNGIAAELAPCDRPCGSAETRHGKDFCFPAAEPYDVIHPASKQKLAGAAMKRNQSGMLIQGSIDARALAGLSREQFTTEFGNFLANWLQLSPVALKGTLPSEDLQRELGRFGSPEWNERR